MVVGMIERGGELRLFAGGMSNNAGIVQPLVYNNVSPEATLITDEAHTYKGLSKEFVSHETVNHGGSEYVRNTIHTNTIEGAFSHLKRTIIGTYHYVSPRLLNRYCQETSYRYNIRLLTDSERFTLSLQQVECRITYKELIAKTEHQQAEVTDQLIKRSKARRSTPVYQIKNGVILQEFPSIIAASLATGINKRGIFRVLSGKKKTTGGYEWQYA